MTVMIDRFFGLPQSLVRGGKLKDLSGVAAELYIGLWHESERFQARELTRTVSELRKLIGGAPNSHIKGQEGT